LNSGRRNLRAHPDATRHASVTRPAELIVFVARRNMLCVRSSSVSKKELIFAYRTSGPRRPWPSVAVGPKIARVSGGVVSAYVSHRV